MPNRIVLLTGDVEAPHLTRFLQHYNSELTVDWVDSLARLRMSVADGTAGCRVVALMTDVIVPDDVLNALDGPAYNFHPGPPEYPGSYAAGFAVYEGARTYGVTFHEMATKVDSGPIIDVRRFEISEIAKFKDVEITAFNLAIEMFKQYAEHLATNDTPLPHAHEVWTGKTRTRAEAESLKTLASDLSEDEINRRYRAFG